MLEHLHPTEAQTAASSDEDVKLWHQCFDFRSKPLEKLSFRCDPRELAHERRGLGLNVKILLPHPRLSLPSPRIGSSGMTTTCVHVHYQPGLMLKDRRLSVIESLKQIHTDTVHFILVQSHLYQMSTVHNKPVCE